MWKLVVIEDKNIEWVGCQDEIANIVGSSFPKHALETFSLLRQKTSFLILMREKAYILDEC